MTHPPAYDPLDTINWMLDEARTELYAETTVVDGKSKKKTKAQRNDDRVRFDTLCAVVWNITGRPEPLETITEKVKIGS